MYAFNSPYEWLHLLFNGLYRIFKIRDIVVLSHQSFICCTESGSQSTWLFFQAVFLQHLFWQPLPTPSKTPDDRTWLLTFNSNLNAKGLNTKGPYYYDKTGKGEWIPVSTKLHYGKQNKTKLNGLQTRPICCLPET